MVAIVADAKCEVNDICLSVICQGVEADRSDLPDPKGSLSASISYAKRVRVRPAAHVRNLPQQEHTKLKLQNFILRGGFVNHMKISTNEISRYTVNLCV